MAYFNIYYLSSSGFFCDRIQSAYIMGVSSQAKYRLIGNLITTINRFSVFSVELRVNPRRFINFVHNVEKVVWRILRSPVPKLFDLLRLLKTSESEESLGERCGATLPSRNQVFAVTILLSTCFI